MNTPAQLPASLIEADLDNFIDNMRAEDVLRVRGYILSQGVTLPDALPACEVAQ